MLIAPQENYLKTQPARIKHLDGPEKVLKQLELMEKASASISDGDLVDTLIHGYVIDEQCTAHANMPSQA